MITVNEAIRHHNTLIAKFGGSSGIRDIAGLEAALARPFATFDQQELYSTGIEKASAILMSLIINHPFVDGNKRIAYLLMQVILIDYNLVVEVAEDDQYAFVISASTGEILFEEIKAWLEANAVNI
jgi:death-on-curing protein